MFRSLLRAAFAVFVVVSGSAAAKAAPVALSDLLDAKTEYQADFYVSSDKGRYGGTVLHAPGRERRDFTTGQGAQALLLRRDIDQAAMLWPDRKWYLSTTFTALSGLIGGFDGVLVDTRQAGRETIAGEPTTRYEVSGDDPQGGRFKGRFWMTPDGIIMKLIGEATYSGKTTPVEMGLSHLARGPVNQSAFALPTDYKGLPLDFSKLNIR